MKTLSVKKGDSVYVIAGRNKGSKGTVEKVISEKDRVVVTGVNISKKSLKRTQSHPKGGLIDFPAPIERSNVMVVCPHCSKPTRVGYTTGADNKTYRFCKHCQGSLDSR